jgi:hypothetical protein
VPIHVQPIKVKNVVGGLERTESFFEQFFVRWDLGIICQF